MTMRTENIETRITRDAPPPHATETIKACSHATNISSEAIGWLPTIAYERAHQRGWLVECRNNDDLVGFVLWRPTDWEIRIDQIWVRPDARLLIHGTALIDHLIDLAVERGRTHLGLWCAEDLAANLFWQALEFTAISWRWGKAKKARRHIQWQRAATPLVTRLT